MGLRLGYRLIIAVAALALSCAPARAPRGVEPVSLRASGVELSFDELAKEATSLLSEYLRVRSVNPPGNESEAALWLKARLEKEGIPTQLFEPVKGRANLYARLKGTGKKRPLILLSHLDVVPATASRWRVDPFSGAVRDGFVWGRGALDMKGETIVQLTTLLALKRRGTPLSRDLILVANADEESDQSGAEWFTKNHPELVRDAEFLINEGLANRAFDDGRTRYWAIDVTEKSALWLRLTARGSAGHGSRPGRDNAVARLVKALARVASYDAPINLNPVAESFFHALAATESNPQHRAWLTNPAAALREPAGVEFFTTNRTYNAVLRNTVSLTVLRGADKTNIIPGEASAEIDIRLLPGEDPDRFTEMIRGLIDDPQIAITRIVPIFRPGTSPLTSEVIDADREVLARLDPGAPIALGMTTGATDSVFYRGLGIHAYGIDPFLLTEAEEQGIHGDNERVSLKNIRFGVEYFYRLVERIAR